MSIHKHAFVFLFLLAFIQAFVSFAQAGYEDVVYLKNGSVIHGVIIEQVPDQLIKIETKDKSVFVFKMEEIEKITKEQLRQNGKKERSPASSEISKEGYTGYAFSIESMFGTGSAPNNRSGISMAPHVINSFMIKSRYSVGLVLGFDYTTLGASSQEISAQFLESSS